MPNHTTNTGIKDNVYSKPKSIILNGEHHSRTSMTSIVVHELKQAEAQIDNHISSSLRVEDPDPVAAAVGTDDESSNESPAGAGVLEDYTSGEYTYNKGYSRSSQYLVSDTNIEGLQRDLNEADKVFFCGDLEAPSVEMTKPTEDLENDIDGLVQRSKDSKEKDALGTEEDLEVTKVLSVTIQSEAESHPCNVQQEQAPALKIIEPRTKKDSTKASASAKATPKKRNSKRVYEKSFTPPPPSQAECCVIL